MAYRRAVETRIALAVLGLLESGTFELAATFSRGSLPVFKKELLSETQVVVVPSRKEGGAIDRQREQLRIDIGIAVTKSVGIGATGRELEVEELLGLVEQIQDWISLRENQILTLSAIEDDTEAEIQPAHNARLVPPFINDPIFDPKVLREEGIFLSVSTFTYHFEALRV